MNEDERGFGEQPVAGIVDAEVSLVGSLLI